MAELAGRLSERVRFERRVGTRIPGGAPDDAWETVCRCWADVVPEGRAQSGLAADRWQAGRRWRVTLRAGPALTLDMRMAWRGLLLRVAGIELDPATPDRVTLWVEDPGI